MIEDRLSPSLITGGLNTHFIGQNVLYYPSLASTMDIARREAQQKAAEGTVVIAGEQTAGRGRKKRSWLSPKGCLALSIILYPGLPYLSSLIMVAALAVVNSIEAVTGLKARIKWPNDVLINGKKVCGILIENEVKGNSVDYTIIGIGLNTNFRVADFPEIETTATSLSDELGKDVSRLALTRSLLVEMEKLYLNLLKGASPYEQWRDKLVTLGKNVLIKAGSATYEGIAESVTRDGGLILRCPDGKLIKIVAGDVSLYNHPRLDV